MLWARSGGVVWGKERNVPSSGLSFKKKTSGKTPYSSGTHRCKLCGFRKEGETKEKHQSGGERSISERIQGGRGWKAQCEKQRFGGLDAIDFVSRQMMGGAGRRGESVTCPLVAGEEHSSGRLQKPTS